MTGNKKLPVLDFAGGETHTPVGAQWCAQQVHCRSCTSLGHLINLSNHTYALLGMISRRPAALRPHQTDFSLSSFNGCCHSGEKRKKWIKACYNWKDKSGDIVLFPKPFWCQGHLKWHELGHTWRGFLHFMVLFQTKWPKQTLLLLCEIRGNPVCVCVWWVFTAAGKCVWDWL